MNNSLPPQILALFLLFPVIIIYTLGYQWRIYSKKYGTNIKTKKIDFRYAWCQVGWVNYRYCMNIAILPKGLFLQLSFPFRLLSYQKPLLIPWEHLIFKHKGLFKVRPDNFEIKCGAKVADKILEHLPVSKI